MFFISSETGGGEFRRELRQRREGTRKQILDAHFASLAQFAAKFSSLTSSTAGQPVQSSLAARSTHGIARDKATARRRKAQFLEHGEPLLKRRRDPLPPRHEPLAEPCPGGLFREKDRQDRKVGELLNHRNCGNVQRVPRRAFKS